MTKQGKSLVLLAGITVLLTLAQTSLATPNRGTNCAACHGTSTPTTAPSPPSNPAPAAGCGMGAPLASMVSLGALMVMTTGRGKNPRHQ
jgi:hypothetical protein